MSRSTPLQNLPNQNKESSNAYDQNENTLVKEILQEIDTDKNQLSQQQHQQQQQAMMDQQQQQAMMDQQQQQQQQQPKPQPQPNQIEINQHMNEQKLMNNQMEENEKTQTLSFVDKIKLNMKQPFIVALIAIIVSIPALTLMLENIVKSKESLTSYANIIILILKGLFAGGLYFGINKSL